MGLILEESFEAPNAIKKVVSTIYRDSRIEID
jgi:hypothetical protein